MIISSSRFSPLVLNLCRTILISFLNFSEVKFFRCLRNLFFKSPIYFVILFFNTMDSFEMICVRFICKECFFTVFTRNSNTYHVSVEIFGCKVITDHKIEAIIFLPILHFFLCVRYFVIICGWFEFDTTSGIIFVVIHNHNVRLAFW